MTYRWTIRLLALLLTPPLALVGLSACGDDEDTVGPEEGADVEDVGEDDDIGDYYDNDEIGELDEDPLVGETVTVSARIDEVIEDQKSFVIGKDIIEGGILVTTPPDTSVSGVTIEEGAEVQIEGEVAELTVADLEAEHESFDLEDDLYTDYEEENIIIASSVSPAPPEDEEGNGDTTTTSGS